VSVPDADVSRHGSGANPTIEIANIIALPRLTLPAQS
jgi:hypothetical protein